MISVKEIHALEEKRKLIKKEIYKKIYEDISKKIRGAVSVGHKQVIFNVPTYLFGYPTFDHKKACDYMRRQLDHSGFTVYQLSNGDIYISWQKEKIQKTPTPTPEPEDDDDFPTFVNLKKIANKLRKQ